MGKVPCIGPGSVFYFYFYFYLINGLAGEKRVVPCAHPSHSRTSNPHEWVSDIVHCAKDGRQRTCGPNGHKKDMCRLESPDDHIGQSPWVGTKGHFVFQVLSFEVFS